MFEQYPFTILVTFLALLVYEYCTFRTARARPKYNVVPPDTDGPPEFRRIYRVQQNTIESLVTYLPSLWLFAFAVGDVWAAAIGVFWPFVRLYYALSYYQSAEKRTPGFIAGFIITQILFLGGFGTTLTKLLF